MQRVEGVRKDREAVFPPVVIDAADRLRQIRVLDSELLQSQADDLNSCGTQIEPADTVALGIGPEPAARLLDRLEQVIELQATLPHAGVTSGSPAGIDGPAVVKNRVVKIEKNGL